MESENELVQVVVTRLPNGSWKVSLFSENECVENYEDLDSECASIIVKHVVGELRAPCKAGGTAP